MTRKLLLGCLALALPLFATASDDWVAVWGAAPQLTEPNNMPPAPGLENATLHQVLRTSAGAKQLRVRVSNAFGDGPLEIRSARVGLHAGQGSVVAGSCRRITFGASESVTIPAGESLLSDPIDLELCGPSDLAVTLGLGEVPDAVTGHPGSRTTSWLLTQEPPVPSPLSGAVPVDHWYLLSGLEARGGAATATLAVLGDSISDGRGSTTNGNDRWPDRLVARLQADPGRAHIAVVNQGIGGNCVLRGGLGPNALSRFERDILDQPGVRWLIIFEGVNDLGGSGTPDATADQLIVAYKDMIARARARGIRVFAGTITPLGGSFYDNPGVDAARQKVNDWIRGSGAFDGVIDFDAAVRDPENPARLASQYDSGDQLHLNPNGYRALADAIDLSLLAE
jgi:lysophospholipase L1-like esterase